MKKKNEMKDLESFGVMLCIEALKAEIQSVLAHPEMEGWRFRVLSLFDAMDRLIKILEDYKK